MTKKKVKRLPLRSRERVKDGDLVYIRNTVSGQQLMDWFRDHSHHLRSNVDAETAEAMLRMTYKFSYVADGIATVYCGPFSGRLPRKFLTVNPDRVDPDCVMPDTREYLNTLMGE